MPLDHLVIPSRDHLFIIDQGDERLFVVLILKKLDDSPFSRLIGCYYVLYFRFTPGRWSSSEMFIAPPKDDKLFLPDLRNRLGLDKIAKLMAESKTLGRLVRLQLDGLDRRQFSTLVREFLRGSASELLQAYCECIDWRFHPVVNGENVEISVHPAAWGCILDSACICCFVRVYTEMKYEEEEDWRSSGPIWQPTDHETYRSKTMVQYGELDYSVVREDKSLCFRASRDNLHALMEDFTSTDTLAGYQSRCRSGAQFCMPPKRIVGEDAGTVTCPAWPSSILKGFTIDGRMYRVCIA